MTEVVSTRRPAPQYGFALVQVELLAPLTAFTPITMSRPPGVVEPPRITFPEAERYSDFVPLSRLAVFAVPTVKLPAPSMPIVKVAPVTDCVVGRPCEMLTAWPLTVNADKLPKGSE